MADLCTPSELDTSSLQQQPRNEDNNPSSSSSEQAHLPSSSFDPSNSTAPLPPTSAGQPTTFTFQAIGYLSSCFKLKFATPRQGSITPSSRASLCLLPHIHSSALIGLSSYSHCWLLFVFHHNTNRSVSTLIHPPRLPHNSKVGLFATRSPHRFNPIGLSLCRVMSVSVEERRLELGSIDLIEGTPILDIKPFHPADQPPHPTAVTYPDWLTALPENGTLSVELDERVRGRLMEWSEARVLERYNEAVDELCTLIVEMISADPRPSFIRHKKEGRQAVFGMRVDTLNVLYWVDDTTQHATVCEVEVVDRTDRAEEQGSTRHGARDGGGTSQAVSAVDERERTKRWLERIGRTDGRRSLKLKEEQAERSEQPSTDTTINTVSDYSARSVP